MHFALSSRLLTAAMAFVLTASLLAPAVPAAGATEGDMVSVAPADSVFDVSVYTSRPRQTIDNFGASGAWSMDPIGREWSEENKRRIADLLFDKQKGIGLSLWRFNIGAGGNLPGKATLWDPWRGIEAFKDAEDAPYDWSRQAGQQWFLRAARERGVEKLLAFTNSPPFWLTVNGKAHCDKDTGSTNLRPGAETAFARYLTDVLKHFAAEGLRFDYISPVNEPNWDWQGGQEGCRYSNADIKRVLVALDAELRAQGVRAGIETSEIGDIRYLLDDADYRTYRRAQSPRTVAHPGEANSTKGKLREQVRDLLGDPEMRRIVGNRISGHSYWSDNSDADLRILRSLLRQNLDRVSPGATYWQSEFCVMEHKRDLGMDTALRVARVIHYDLTMAEASAWHWWLAVSNGDYKDGLVYTDWGPKVGPQNVLPSKTLWALGNYSRFLRPGSRRVEVSTNALPDDLLASAYQGVRGDSMVVVLTNANSAPRTVRLRFDCPVGALTPWVTSAEKDLAAELALTDTTCRLPPRSVVTLVGRFKAGADKNALPTLPSSERITRPRTPASSADATLLYDVRCGREERVADDQGGTLQSRWDQPWNDDPGTGFHWGFFAYGTTGGRRDGGAGPDTGVRWEEGDTPGEGITYRFEVPESRRYTLEIALADPWGNTERRLDLSVNGVVVAPGVVPAEKASGSPLRYSGIRPVNGALEVTLSRAAGTTQPGADPLISAIRIREENTAAP